MQFQLSLTTPLKLKSTKGEVQKNFQDLMEQEEKVPITPVIHLTLQREAVLNTSLRLLAL